MKTTICPQCGRRVVIRTDGKIAGHMSGVNKPWCSGSDLHADKVRDRNRRERKRRRDSEMV